MDTEHSTDERHIGVHPPAASLNNEHSPANRLATIDSFHDIQASSIFEEVAQ